MSTLYVAITEPFEESVAYQNDNGSPRDLTNHTSYIRVSKYYGSSPIATLQGTIQSPASAGIVKYTGESTTWTNFSAGAHVFTRYLFDGTGKVVSADNGILILIPGVPVVPPPAPAPGP